MDAKTKKEIVSQPNPCCPALDPKKLCDIMRFSYRLNYLPEVKDFQRFSDFNLGIEVKLSFKYSRCPGDLVQGDLVYTNTLLPGESVKLFTSDRRSKFVYDSANKVSYKNTQSSEESMQAQQMSDSMFDFSSRDEQNSSYQNKAHVDGHGDAGVDILGFGGEANMSGNFNSEGTSSFADELKQHAESKHHESESSTRKASSMSIGEVQSRTHTESESEDHFESSSREFKNPNHCHAITFFFYRIDKTFTVRFELDAISVRVYNKQLDNTRVSANPIGRSTGVSIVSEGVMATQAAPLIANQINPSEIAITNRQAFRESFPIQQNIIQEVTKIVIQELITAGLLNKDKTVTKDAQEKFGFERQMALPTPGIMVKGCMDECDICEPEVQRAIELDLQNKHLQNELLKKQIELLDKSQEYRCCPDGSVKPA